MLKLYFGCDRNFNVDIDVNISITVRGTNTGGNIPRENTHWFAYNIGGLHFCEFLVELFRAKEVLKTGFLRCSNLWFSFSSMFPEEKSFEKFLMIQ